MNNMFNTVEELSKFIMEVYSPKFRTFKNIFSNLNRLTSLNTLLDQGFNKDDIVFAIKRQIKLEHHYCPYCGKEIHVYKLLRYPKTCSVACGVKHSQKLRKENSLKKYGVENPAQLQSNKDKYKRTMIERYGGFTLQSQQLLAKVTQTNMKKYGVPVAGSNKELHKKNIQTCLQRYGVEHTSQLKENREKAADTNFRIHGSRNYNNREQICKTCIEKYGVKNAMQFHDIRIKTQTKYFYNGLNFDSSWEIAYYIWLTDNNIQFTYQPDEYISYTYKRKVHYYCPDFKVDGQLVEIKGSQYFNKTRTRMNCPYNKKLNGLYNAKYKCMLANNVLIISDDSIQPYLTYVNSKYGKIYLQSFKRKNGKTNCSI